jgi:hypothetical protein
VSGLPWSSEPTKVHIDSLGSKCLCEGHNNELNYLDDAAIDFNNALRRLDEDRIGPAVPVCESITKVNSFLSPCDMLEAL